MKVSPPSLVGNSLTLHPVRLWLRRPCREQVGQLGIAFRFWLADRGHGNYGIGPIRACHVNPASASASLPGRMDGRPHADLLGRPASSGHDWAPAFSLLIASGKADYDVRHHGLGPERLGSGYLRRIHPWQPRIVFEIVATFLFLVVILVRRKQVPTAMAGLSSA